jgi:hypothetical protein
MLSQAGKVIERKLNGRATQDALPFVLFNAANLPVLQTLLRGKPSTRSEEIWKIWLPARYPDEIINSLVDSTDLPSCKDYKNMKFFKKMTIIMPVAISLLFCGQNARAGTLGVEQFNLLDRVQTDLTLVEYDPLNDYTCFCGPFDGARVPPPETISHGNLPIDGEWFDATFLEGAPIYWYVTYGVDTPTDPSVFSQYCTVSANTSTYSDLTEDVRGWCWTLPDQTCPPCNDCPTCDVVTFADWYNINEGEGGIFAISAPTLAAVSEPSSLVFLVTSLFGLILIWVRRRWLYHGVWEALARGA